MQHKHSSFLWNVWKESLKPIPKWTFFNQSLFFRNMCMHYIICYILHNIWYNLCKLDLISKSDVIKIWVNLKIVWSKGKKFRKFWYNGKFKKLMKIVYTFNLIMGKYILKFGFSAFTKIHAEFLTFSWIQMNCYW